MSIWDADPEPESKPKREQISKPPKKKVEAEPQFDRTELKYLKVGVKRYISTNLKQMVIGAASEVTMDIMKELVIKLEKLLTK